MAQAEAELGREFVDNLIGDFLSDPEIRSSSGFNSLQSGIGRHYENRAASNALDYYVPSGSIKAAVGALTYTSRSLGRQVAALRAPSSAIQPYYPPNRGFAGIPRSTTLSPGTRIDRYGSELGTFASPAGTPFGARSLPAGAAAAPLRAYEVIRPLPAQYGPTAPWFGQLGGGTQYEFAQSIEALTHQGYLRTLP